MRQFTRHNTAIFALIFSLSLIFSAAMPIRAEGDYMGKTVTVVEVTGCIHVNQSTVFGVIKLKPGEALTVERLNDDINAIYDLGYFFDVFVNFVVVPEGVKVLYTVMENPILNDIVIHGATKVSEDKLKEFVTNKPGDVINTRSLNNNTENMRNYYHEQGFILAKIDDVSMRPGGILSITINEGMLEDIIVKGNKKTKTKVITREMKLEKGQPFNANRARTSMQNVYNLGYFEDVNMRLNPGHEPNGVVMQIDVEEQKTGVFTIGGGYSQNDGTIGIIELGDNNFGGRGDKAKIHWEIGGASNKNYELSYARPWLDSKRTYLGFSFYNMTNQFADYEKGHQQAVYDRKRRGYDLTLGRPSGDKIFNYITFRNRNDDFVRHIRGEDYSKDPAYMANNFGLTRSIILSRVLDTRDNHINPSTGTRTSVTTEFAGLGGDFSFKKYTAENRKYFRVGKKQVFAFRLTGGLAHGKISNANRFAIGGIDTVRGYRDDEFKGNKMLAATAEYRFPMVDKIEGVVFSDVGNAWSGAGHNFKDFKSSVGVGIRLGTPLGPIRIDVARGSQGMRTHFSFGGQF
jgi:outer membrane protein insertion porin family